jgi:flagellar biosynthesis/type III secretory pathway M-ring protein FliF/YscJ
VTTRDQEEQDLRCDQMAVNIEKMRFDIEEKRRDAVQQQRWETRRFLVAIVLAAAALVGAGIAIGNYFARPVQLPPQIQTAPR